jgi:integrase
MRIGEALALRRKSVVLLDTERPRLLIDAHVVPVTPGSSAHGVKSGLKETKVSRGKTTYGSRFMDAPDAVIAALRDRLSLMSDEPDALLFASRTGTVLAPSNVRRSLRQAAKRAGLTTTAAPHSFRKLIATEIDRLTEDDGKSAAGYIGNTPSVATEYYIAQRIRESGRIGADISDALMRRVAPDRFEVSEPA